MLYKFGALTINILADLFHHLSAEYSKLISKLGFSISIINLL
jgi:hypothetical protein